MTTSRSTIFILLILTFCSCSDTKKKEELCEAFRAFNARDVPSNIFNLKTFKEFEILSQNRNSINESYNYPNTFVIGMYSNTNKSYDRIHVIEGFSPIENYKLIKAASDYYTSDTTYLDNIQLTDTIYIDNKDAYLLKDTIQRFSINEMQSSFKMKNKKYVALIYRKTNPLKDSTIGDFAMWKREIIKLEVDTLKTETLEKMNEHLF
jgi:hypothetical protein